MGYEPGITPEATPSEILSFVVSEFRKISEAFKLLEADGVHLNPLAVAPGKDVPALVVYARAGVLGVNEGVYRHDSGGSWVYVG